MEITILSDVYAGLIPQLTQELLAEYGFAALLQKEDVQILFDTGLTGDVLLHNASKLGVELKPDYIVISHGHRDHTGGLKKVLEVARAPIVVHPDAFDSKFARINGVLREIGIPFKKDQLGVPVITTRLPLELVDGVYFSGEIPREWGPSHSGLVYRLDPEKGIVQDLVKDDAALYVKTPKGLVVITGCGHAGVENVVEYGLKVTNSSNLRALIGGLHLLGANEERIREVAKYLASKSPELVIPTHCTGQIAQYVLMKELGDSYRQGGPGVRCSF
ncbi:beta-lactamase [Ignicoccus islandicus DSM 13165]|uniref:Beta-lactamase n=1 Tax=Ignicoccus islandicus DSM 13165 TaxID=940295 RepID=A0A0U3G094_9CREN|nr:MBL fold metallo-hydrolase [Ignicoccus islandicus]ALU11740.1 beta-lactamase [Ignicoccus islandicus DSM 13165]